MLVIVSQSPRSSCRRSLVVDCLMLRPSLTHRSPVAVRPRPAGQSPAATAAHDGRTVRLRRRFTSDTAGYWVQLFTLGSVTALSSTGEPHPVSPLCWSVGRQSFDAAIDFSRWRRADAAAVVRTWTTASAYVSTNCSIHVGVVLVGLTRASGVVTDERRTQKSLSSFLLDTTAFSWWTFQRQSAIASDHQQRFVNLWQHVAFATGNYTLLFRIFRPCSSCLVYVLRFMSVDRHIDWYWPKIWMKYQIVIINNNRGQQRNCLFVSEAVRCSAKGKCGLILRHFPAKLVSRCSHLHLFVNF